MKTALLAGVAFGSLLFAYPSAFAQQTPPPAAGLPDAASVTAPGGAVLKNRAPVSRETVAVHFKSPTEYKLSNGLRLLILEDDRAPVLHATFLLPAGTLAEEKPGVASLTAQLLEEGTASRSGQKIAEEAQEIGASIGSGEGLQWTSVAVTGLSENTDNLMDLLADVLLHPSFPDDRLRRAQAARVVGLQRVRTNPTLVASLLESKTLYAGTPLARQQTTPAQLRAITRDDLLAYHRAHYVPNGAILAVTGDIKAKDFKNKMESLLRDWKPDPAAPLTPATPPSPVAANSLVAPNGTKVYLVDRPGSQQTVIEWGNLSLKQTDPDYIPLVVATRILGGGASDRLFQNLRESKGYTYGAYARLSAGPQWPGLIRASASVRTEVTGPALTEFVHEFDRIQQAPVDDAELANAKSAIIGSLILSLQSPDAVLGRTLEVAQNNLPTDYWDTYARRINAVTKADIQRVAQKYLGHNRMQLFVVGERSAIEPSLAAFGPVSLYDTQGNPVVTSAPANSEKPVGK